MLRISLDGDWLGLTSCARNDLSSKNNRTLRAQEVRPSQSPSSEMRSIERAARAEAVQRDKWRRAGETRPAPAVERKIENAMSVVTRAHNDRSPALFTTHTS